MTATPLVPWSSPRSWRGSPSARSGSCGRATFASSAARCFRPAPPSRWRWPSWPDAPSTRHRRRWCCRSACRTCRSTCASTRCPRSSCCCWAPRPSAISLFSAGLFPLERRDRARPHLLPVPRVPRGDGAGAGRRRRVRVHGRVGDDGAGVVLPRHHRPPHPGDPPRRLPVPADRARRRDRHPALLRRAAGRQRRLHVRLDAFAHADRRMAHGRLLPGARRLRRQGRACCRCTSGCRRRTRRRRRRCRR